MTVITTAEAAATAAPDAAALTLPHDAAACSELAGTVGILQQLIACNTVSSPVSAETDNGHQNMVSYLTNKLRHLGFYVLRLSSDPDTSRLNILALSPALFRPEDIACQDHGLLLSGHYDTVSFAAEKWQTNPLELTLKNERLYGRGCCDMKGYLACMLQIATRLHELKLLEKTRVSLIFSCEEETTMNGAQAVMKLYQDSSFNPEVLELLPPEQQPSDLPPVTLESALDLWRSRKFGQIVIGEATSLDLVLGHKGWLCRDLILTGSGGHSSRAALNDGSSQAPYNAMEGLEAVTQEFRKHKERLAQNYQDEHFTPPYPTSNLGTIKGGHGYNTICPELTVGFDLRAVPSASADTLKILDQLLANINARLPADHQARMAAPAADIPAFGAKIEQGPGADYYHKLRRQLVIAAGTGSFADIRNAYVAYCTEASFFQDMGELCVICGPGSIAAAHQDNEYVELSELSGACAFLYRLLNTFSCKESHPELEAAASASLSYYRKHKA